MTRNGSLLSPLLTLALITPAAAGGEYEQGFDQLHQLLGRRYPAFALKKIDWPAVGRELRPRAGRVTDDAAFGLLCMELVARLEDSHAHLLPGRAALPRPDLPRFDPGMACLIDERGRPVVYHVDPGGPAARAGVRPGLAVRLVNGLPARRALQATMKQLARFSGYSSRRFLRYHAARFFLRQALRGAQVRLELVDLRGKRRRLRLPAALGVRYLPRLPVPHEAIADAGEVSWRQLGGGAGYVYVRRIRARLVPLLEKAMAALKPTAGLIVDVRGNSGGGFDARRAHLPFRDYSGRIALLIDARCLSAGEGWASWFVANRRATLFGEATAGASARKTVAPVHGGLFKVRFPVKLYRGYLDRPIERRGLIPDRPLMQTASDLAAGRDTVLEAALSWLRSPAGKGDR